MPPGLPATMPLLEVVMKYGNIVSTSPIKQRVRSNAGSIWLGNLGITKIRLPRWSNRLYVKRQDINKTIKPIHPYLFLTFNLSP